jgi:hypothetical protein
MNTRRMVKIGTPRPVKIVRSSTAVAGEKMPRISRSIGRTPKTVIIMLPTIPALPAYLPQLSSSSRSSDPLSPARYEETSPPERTLLV